MTEEDILENEWNALYNKLINDSSQMRDQLYLLKIKTENLEDADSREILLGMNGLLEKLVNNMWQQLEMSLLVSTSNKRIALNGTQWMIYTAKD